MILHKCLVEQGPCQPEYNTSNNHFVTGTVGLLTAFEFWEKTFYKYVFQLYTNNVSIGNQTKCHKNTFKRTLYGVSALKTLIILCA